VKRYRCMNRRCSRFNSTTTGKRCVCGSTARYPRSDKRRTEE
jgi:hypothetical protein